ncbi:MAG: TIGR03364 family FAD-dependent oxidoreductase [Burkholderiales bacterium]|nr:MAG: TIGR03364 family FAD-dependent oxidoreductase [Burkholderiales bacterium]
MDLNVVGAGIVGLAHALIASQKGLRVRVIEKDHRCVGASIRNFGFITVTGQRSGLTWQRAMRSRDVWQSLASEAGLRIEHCGLWMLARQALSVPVLEAFLQTEMGSSCELHTSAQVQVKAPWLRCEDGMTAMYSPHELRFESSIVIPRIAAWLQERYGVEFQWAQDALEVQGGTVRTATHRFEAERAVLCPGTYLNGIARPWLKDFALHLTRLQMLRVRPPTGFKLDAAAMSDLSLVRYLGYAKLPQAQALLAHLQQTEAQSLADGIHLIAVQSEDGSLVVGDSHHPHATPDPFSSDAVDALILRHLRQSLRLDQFEVIQRWTGVYPTGIDQDAVILSPDDQLRIAVVSSGCGASTAFGLAQDVFQTW